MQFSTLAESLARMESTSKRLELTEILVDLFRRTPIPVMAKIVYLLQGKLRPEFEGVELGVAEKLAVRAIAKSSGVPMKEIERVYRRDGDLGRAAAAVLRQKSQTTFVVEEITVERVYDTLMKIAKAEGRRSQDMKMRYISSLLNDANPREAGFILKILLGMLRLGIAENTVMDALAVAFMGSKENRGHLERAYNVSSDLGRVAETVASRGLDGMADFGVRVFSPIRPMLAERVKSGAEAVEKMGGAFSAEYKLDGERVQIHLGGGTVELFSRRLERITEYYPDIVERIPDRVASSEAVLEAEVVAINEETGEFLPFQELMHRRRKHGIDEAVSKYPVSVNFFDVLYADGKSLLEEGYLQRRAVLEGLVRQDEFARNVTASAVGSEAEVEEVLEDSVNSGCEGLMLKAPDAPYQAGARGSHWLKLKREYRNELGDSLDLVIVGAFFGKGRRTGRYGTLLLAAYDSERDVFPSICKVGTGFTDADLDRLYQILSTEVVLKRDPRVESVMEADVWFEPKIVIEVVASEITLSPVHRTAMDSIRKNSGLALRFPKFTGRMRMEKAPEDASTDQEIIALYNGQRKISHERPTNGDTED